MTCKPDATVTLVLDSIGGWNPAIAEGLVGLERPGLVRLAPASPAGMPGAVPRATVEHAILPPWLATDGRGRWFLAVKSAVLVLDPCNPAPYPLDLEEAGATVVAVTADRGRLAVARQGRAHDQISVYAVNRSPRRAGERVGESPRLLGGALVEGVQALAFGSGGTMMAARSAGRLERFGLAGDRRSGLRVTIPGNPVGDATGLLTVRRPDAPGWQLVHASMARTQWRSVCIVDAVTGLGRPLLRDDVAALPRVPGLVAVSDQGFTVHHDRGTVTIGRDGARIDSGVLSVGPEPLVEHGQLVTVALDSGIEDCRWHRVVVDADEAPPATSWAVDVVARAKASDLGALLDSDWSEVARDGRPDGLVRDQRAGQYLIVRLRLRGDGSTTPVVRRVAIHAGRATGLDHLPVAYRADPDAAEFTERFLALFDAAVADVDEVIELAPLLLRAAALPDQVLPALARMLGLDVDPSWSAQQIRTMLAHAPVFARRAGTPRGLTTLLMEVLGVTDAVEEHGAARPWAGLRERSPSKTTPHRAADHRNASGSDPALGAFRLYGRARAALILGSSHLGEAPLRADVDIAADAGASGAHRCTIHVAPGPHTDDARARAAIERLIRWAIPAHVGATVHFARPGMTVTGSLHVGVDTVVLGPPLSVLSGPGDRLPRLGRTAIVGPADGARTPRLPGRPLVVGLDTTAR